MRRGARRWLGLDGEGIGRGPHRYVLLCASDADGAHETLEDERGLSTPRCLDWLLRFATRDVVLAGFYLSYDWTMMLSDLPAKLLYRLWRPELRALPKGEGGGFSPVRWRDYRLHWLAGMMRVGRGQRSVTIWDLGKYYQEPFVAAVQRWRVLDDDQLAMVRAMKARRATFATADRDDVRRYCALECQALAELAARLERAHVAVGLRPRGWYGPGATAAVLLRRERIHERRGEIPPAVADAADRAFAGGRFEQSALGRHRVRGHDIVSAYPYAALLLPCLEHGRWERVTREREAVSRSVRHAVVRWRLSDVGTVPWGPLPVRLDKGRIIYPRSGATGWTWRTEYQAARKHWSGVHFGGEAWVLRGECDCRPFAPLLDLFRQRAEVGKQSGPGIVLKLAANSVPGKLMQSVGAAQYASRVWAGMVTSQTRAQLLSAIATHDDWADVVAVATDGVYTRDLDWTPAAPPLAPDMLGAWETSAPQDIVFLRPGIYCGPDVVRARGVGRALLAGRTDLCLTRSHVELGVRAAFGAARQSVYMVRGRAKRSPNYGQWRDVAVRVSLDPAPKRAPDWGLVALGGVDSAPYSGKPRANASPLLELLRDSKLLRD